MTLFALSLCVGVFVVLSGSLTFVRTCLLVVTVINQSMSPTLEPGDRILALRKHIFPSLKKGQIVVFTLQQTGRKELRSLAEPFYIKRIVALGGETVETAGSGTWREGMPPHQERTSWYVPAGSIFVCGDNEPSFDSRMWGPLPERSVQGVFLLKLTRKALLPSISPAQLGLPPGQPAPAFRALSLDGGIRTLHDYVRQNVLLLFLGTNNICRQQVPAYLIQLANAFAGGVVVVCVFVGDYDDLAKISTFVEELHMTTPILFAPPEQNTFRKDYRVPGTPAYCYIDEQGIVVAAGIPGDASWRKLVLAQGQQTDGTALIEKLSLPEANERLHTKAGEKTPASCDQER
jgi:signal peptidase I